MRAYGGSVNRCLQEAGYDTIQDLDDVLLSVPFQYTQSIHNLVKKFDAHIKSEEFNESGALIKIEILSDKKEKFIMESINLSKGLIKINKLD